MKRTQIYLPHSQLLALRQRAQKQRTTVSDLIRQYIHVQIVERETVSTKQQKTQGMQSLFKLADKFKWRGVKGPKDLAQNLDNYLYGGK